MKRCIEENLAVLCGTLICGGAALLGAAIWVGAGKWESLLLSAASVVCLLVEARLYAGRENAEKGAICDV